MTSSVTMTMRMPVTIISDVTDDVISDDDDADSDDVISNDDDVGDVISDADDVIDDDDDADAGDVISDVTDDVISDDDDADAANVQLSFSKNGWMTSDVLLVWVRQTWGPNRDDVQCLLVLDQAPIHKTDAARKALVAKDTNVVFVPGGCTSIVQPADVS
ncbi:hypothetical protein ISCGN_009912 [Ixodes scapularis]